MIEMLFKSIAIVASLMSLSIWLSYWGELGASFKLRGGEAVKVKSDARLNNEPHADADRLRRYNLSPYETHWPGFALDPWMRKDVSVIPSKKNEVCLVHVGKSAGFTAACALGFNAPFCEHPNAIGLLPIYTTKWSHAGEYDCFDDSAYYLFIVRNPLDRAVSAFNYGKPVTWEQALAKHGKAYYERLKSLYLDCFDTIEQLADWGLSRHGNATDVCKRRAIEAIEGTTRFENHLYFNFQYHLEAIPKDGSIITLRTEHLIQDWNSAEYAVGGKKDLLQADQTLIPRINTGNPKEDKNLSDDSRQLICERLCNEIQVYKHILNVSINLSKEQVDQSLEELKLSCPTEASATSCKTPLLDMTDRLRSNRGYDRGLELDASIGEISVGRSVHRINTVR